MTQPLTSLKIRILHQDGFAMGPGKATLLEAIAETRSIAAAGRKLGWSYWKTRRLLDELNHSYRSPVVVTVKGGATGGGSRLTETGVQALVLFRGMEAEANKAIAPMAEAFRNLLAES
jgi:molybdate transport system regulatory protein